MYLLVIQAGISMPFSSVLIPRIADNREIELNTNLSSGFFMDRLGRRKTGLFIYFPFTISWLIMSFVENVTMIYLARIISGITAGLTTCSVVYVAEISSKTTRSALLCMNSVWVSFGIFITYFLNYFDLHWRTIGYAYAVLSSLCILAILIVPESSQWLLVFNKKVNDERKGIKSSQHSLDFTEISKFLKFTTNDLIRSNDKRIMGTFDDNDTCFFKKYQTTSGVQAFSDFVLLVPITTIVWWIRINLFYFKHIPKPWSKVLE
ncbi:CLUMA_CG015222, isoform A [Clunio marinus]|uniref:CLUMA_CG015222, isoform A n=1 Tax=Clunio marinus TaxID=568069 RepID=A0A1J1IQJ9_9DIPT|nr:CLUMA_CG015222, isoform A [Clunio marinus]